MASNLPEAFTQNVGNEHLFDSFVSVDKSNLCCGDSGFAGRSCPAGVSRADVFDEKIPGSGRHGGYRPSCFPFLRRSPGTSVSCIFFHEKAENRAFDARGLYPDNHGGASRHGAVRPVSVV